MSTAALHIITQMPTTGKLHIPNNEIQLSYRKEPTTDTCDTDESGKQRKLKMPVIKEELDGCKKQILFCNPKDTVQYEF